MQIKRDIKDKLLLRNGILMVYIMNNRLSKSKKRDILTSNIIIKISYSIYMFNVLE